MHRTLREWELRSNQSEVSTASQSIWIMDSPFMVLATIFFNLITHWKPPIIDYDLNVHSQAVSRESLARGRRSPPQRNQDMIIGIQ